MIQKRMTSRGVRYDVRLRRPDGRVYTRTFVTRKDAERFERNELAARDRGDWIDPRLKARTFADVAAEWLASNPGKRASTVARDRFALERYLLPALGERQIGSIVPRDIQDVVAAMANRLAPSTVHRNYRVAAAVFRYAVDRDYLAKSPCRTVKLPAVRRTEAHVFTPSELAALAGAMPVEYAPMVWLGAVLGLRWGEVAALRVADVDLLAAKLHVRRTLTRDARGATKVGEPKSAAGRRTLALPDALRDVLAAHMAALGVTAADEDALLFPAPRGGLLTASTWRQRVWVPAAVAAGVGTVDDSGAYSGATFHDLRRTSATELAVAGVDVKTAQTRLGHSAVRLTLELYAQAVPEAEVAASDVLASRLMRSPEAG